MSPYRKDEKDMENGDAHQAIKESMKRRRRKMIPRDDLTPEESAALDKMMMPARDKGISFKFATADVVSWHAEAEKAGCSITAWIERALNAARDKAIAKRSATAARRKR